MSGLFHLAYYFQVHPYWSMYQNFYGYLIFHSMDRSHFILSFADGHLGCFQLLAIMSNVAMNIGMQVSVWASILNSFVYVPGDGSAGS